MIIAIDGPAASGKGTLAKRIAAHFGLAHLDTGLLYRAVARDVRKARRRPGRPGGRSRRGGRASTRPPWTTRPCAIRGWARRPPSWPASRRCEPPCWTISAPSRERPEGAVLDGRDIGTVVCPDADVKLYVTASRGGQGRAPLPGEARPRRAGHPARRSWTTSGAAMSATRAGKSRRCGRPTDAFLLDTSNLDIEAAFDTAVGVISRKVGQRGRA